MDIFHMGPMARAMVEQRRLNHNRREQLLTVGRSYGLNKQGTDMDGLYNPKYDRSNTGYFGS